MHCPMVPSVLCPTISYCPPYILLLSPLYLSHCPRLSLLSSPLFIHTIILRTCFVPADSDADFVDIDHCSPLNSKLWTSLTQWLSALAPTPIHTLTNTHTLLTHLTASQPLDSLKPYLNVSSSTEWKHFVLSQEDNVTQLYLPDMFYRREGTFVLPLVIMDCQLAHLMDPDPMGKELPCKSPDLHVHCPLAARLATPSDVREGLEHLLFSLGNAHVISYLDVLSHALSSNQNVSYTSTEYRVQSTIAFSHTFVGTCTQ